MSKPDLKIKTRLAMSELLDRVLGSVTPRHPATPSRALDLSELEERILLSASPVAVAAEMAEPAPADALVEESTLVSSEAMPSAETESSQAQQTSSTVSTSPSQNVSREIVFLDTSVENYQQLLDDLWANDDPNREIEVVLLSNSRDGIDQITETLADRSEIDSVHLVSHGTDRAVKLGSTWLTNDNLAGYAGEIARWGNSLSASADVLFYGCNLAGSESGLTLLESVQMLTGADIAASTDDTGAAVLGGDWDLEVELGAIESTVVFSEMAQGNWHGLLNTFTVTNTNDSGAGSLRQAIIDANALNGFDTIEFNIGGGGQQTIALTSTALPTISDALIIDGSTQGGFVAGTPLIEIDGSALGGSINGLVITAGDSTVRALMINGFTDDGIDIRTNGGNTIVGNWIGTDGTGSVLAGNADDGIDIQTANNIIGGTSLADRNVITNNASNGISIESVSATGNIITGNYIGLNPDGTTGLGNAGEGINVQTGASNNIIGGTATGAGNVISANTGNGIRLQSGASGNRIQGNLIGTAADGTTDKGNTSRGIRIGDSGTDDNLIGGTEAGAGNVIAFNNEAGIRAEDGVRNSFIGNTFIDNGDIGIDLDNDGVTANDSGDSDPGANNLQNYPVLSLAQSTGDGTVGISGTLNSTANTTFRIEFFVNATNGADVQAEEFLGAVTTTTDGSGNADFVGVFYETVALGDFITATATVDNDDGTFGDTSELAANREVTAIPVITVDTTSEAINGTTTSFASLNSSKGGDNAISLPEAIQAANATAGIELIEFNIAGDGPHTISITSALPTITGPVIIDGSSQETFGGNDNAAVDEVTTGPEIIIDADATSGVAGFRIEGDGVTLRSVGVTNTHGTAVDGSGIYVNGDYFSIDDVTVTNSGVVGIFVLESSYGSITNSIARNNGLDTNVGDGIAIQGPLTDVTISGNTLIDNAAFGIDFASGASENVTVINNLIKDNGSGGSVQQAGIGLRSGDNHTFRNNTITGNTGDGIVVTNGQTGNFFSQNAIFDNGDLGIDLSNGTALSGNGVTSNDSGDGDPGGNNLQNYPVLTSATTADGQTTIAGTFNGAASTEFLIEFFSSATGDASGFGEARRYIGSTTITTNGSGNATISELLNVPTGVGAVITATASADNGNGGYENTSEFAQNVTVTGTSVVTVTTTSDTADGDTSSIEALFADKGADNRISLREAMLATSSSANGVSVDEIRFNIPTDDANYNGGNGTWLIQPATALPFIQEGVTIDATTQTDYSGTPLIDLDGSAIAADGADGFETDAGDITIKGFVIRNFDGAGIDIQDGSDNIVESNYIGTDATGTVAQANGIGIRVFGGADVTTIGGLTAAQSNIIAFNTGDGIEVEGAGAVSIQRNSIFGNGGLGIDLVSGFDPASSVTANDAGDSDNGSNGLQNFPVLNTAVTDGSTEIDIAGSINTTAGETVLVQFFANDSNDDTGHGEGQTYLGATSVTAGSDGNATFDITFSAAVAEGAFISATATNAGGSTSEFALSVEATGPANTRPYFGANGDGIVTTAIPGSSTDFGFGSVVQSDGKVIVAGTSSLTDFDISLVRYHADGSIDHTFGGGDGIVTFDAGGNEFGFDVALQSDGKIIVIGQTDIGADIDALVARFTTEGVLDTTFDTDGFTTLDISGDDSFGAVAIQADGKIVAVGTNDGGGHDFTVVRYNADGSLDSSFDSDGVFTHDFGGNSFDQATSVALQSDGKIVVGGSSAVQFGLIRLTTTGVLDTTFDTDGVVTTDFGAGNETINSLAIQTDGKIVAGGTANLNFALARYNVDGSLDTTFDTDGLQTSDLGGTEQAYDIALTSTEKIVISGSTDLLGDNDVTVQRYNSDGSIDTSFNSVGTRITVDAGTNGIGYSINSLFNDKIVVGGNISSGGFLLNRYLESGPEDTSFGATLSLLNGTPTFTEGGSAVVLDSDVQVFDTELTATGNYDGATLTLVRNGGANSDDVFSHSGNLQTLTESGALTLTGPGNIGTVTTNSGGTLVLTFNASATESAVHETLQSIAYSNSNDTPPDSVLLTWAFNDGNTGDQGPGGALAATGSTVVDITATNASPTVSNLDGDTLNYSEGDGAQLIEQEGDAVVSDADSADFSDGTVIVEIDSGLQSGEDVLSIRNQGTDAGEIGTSGNNVTFGGTVIGSFSGGTGITPLTVTLNSSATPTAVTALVKNLTYENTNTDSPVAGMRNIAIDVTDGDGGPSSTQDVTVNVSAVNDRPVADLNGADGDGINFSNSFDEGDSPVNITDSDATISDPDHTAFQNLGINLSGFVDGTSEVIRINSEAFTVGVGRTTTTTVGSTTFDLDFDGSGFTITNDGGGTFSGADAQSLLRTVTYENTSQNPTNGNRTFNIIPQDASSLNASPEAVSTITVNAVNDDPSNTGSLPTDVTVTEDVSSFIDLSSIHLSDPDHNNQLVTLTLRTSTGGRLFAGSDIDVIVSGSGFAILQLTGGVDDINTFLNSATRISYLHGTPHTNGDNADTIQVEANDQGNTGTGGGGTVVFGTVNVDITPVNDTPNADASAGIPYSIIEGESLILDGSSSSDVDGDGLTYEWDLDADGTYDVSGENPTVSWATLQSFGIDDDGSHTVVLRTTDPSDASDTATFSVTVVNAAPTLTVTGSGIASIGSAYTVTLDSSDFGADTITSWTINWGDGTIDTLAGDPTSASHTYSTVHAGRNITVSATDEDGTFLASELLVASSATDEIIRFAPNTAAFIDSFGSSSDPLDLPSGVRIGPDGNIYVSGFLSDNILKYNGSTGALIGEFVAPGSGGLSSPGGLEFGPDGNLYVSDASSDRILRYNGTTGAFIDEFVSSGSGGLSFPGEIHFYTDGFVYVTSGDTNEILRYNGETGAFDSAFVSAGSGGLSQPRGIAHGADGHLYVGSRLTNEVLRYDGTTGAFVDTFVAAGSGGLVTPRSIRFGADGLLYVGSDGTDEILRYNGTTGAFVDTFVSARRNGLDTPFFLEFTPQHQVEVVSNVVTVDTTSDVVDGTTTSIAALIGNKGADGVISLREAILATNNTTNVDASTPDQIHFEITAALVNGAHTIQVGNAVDGGNGALPSITDAVILDGTTDSDFSTTPVIELDGTFAGGSARGLHLNSGSDGSTIRGFAINRFGDDGIHIVSDNNTIVGNLIGLNPAGTTAVGNGDDGVHINGGANNTIGGSTPEDRNIIADSGSDGIIIQTSGATGNIIQGNYIGTDITGTVDFGNTGEGIRLLSGAGSTQIGGVNDGEGNLIAFNSGRGVSVEQNVVDNSILRNIIHSNGALEIDLGRDGVTNNDADDSDPGDNNLQNYPVLSSATTNGSNQVNISGSLSSATSQTFRIEFFASSTPDASGFGGAERFLGSTNVTTSPFGVATFSKSFAESVAVGESITATATDSSGNTSEFAQNVSAASTNTSPVITLPGSGLSYTENDPASVIDPGATVTDAESANFDGGEFRTGFAGGTGRTGDRLAIRNQGAGAEQIGVSGSNVTYEGTTIGTFTGGTSSTPLVVSLNSNATPTAVQALARNVTFENTSDNPAETTRTVRFDALDGDGGDATNVDTTVDVTAENDAPEITSNGGEASAAIDVEDGTTVVTTITSSDPDGGTASYSISGGADSASFNIDSASGVLTLKTAANFATPTDANGDGVYEVTVEVSDGAGGTDSQSIEATIVAPDIRIIYGQSTDASPQFLEFDTIRDILPGEQTTTESGRTIRWVTSVVSPDGEEELVAILSDTGSATELNLLRWDGESWTVDWTVTDITSANSNKQGFSIAYESSSGHAVAVYSNNTANPVYRVWNGSDWSAEANVFATPPGTGTVLWVELASSPTSDEITLVYSDSAELHTVVWDGDAWNEAATENTLETNLSGAGNSRAFDVAYESSGDVLIAWGDSSNVDFETRAAGTTTWVDGNEFPIVSGIITFVDLAADPTSDRIAFAGIDDNAGTERLGLMTWDGSTWQDVGEYDNEFAHVETDGFGEFWAGVGWVGTTGEAIAVYSDDDAGVLNWASWTTDSGWTIESDFTVTGADLLRSVELAGYGNDGLVTVFSDQSGSLWGLTYEDGSWTVLNGGAALETSVSDLKTKPFSLSVERFGGNDASIVDLNGSNQDGQSFSTSFTEGGGRVSITDTDATVSDIDHTTYQSLSVNLGGFSDGADEEVRINSEPFKFGASRVATTTVGATTFNLDFDGSGFAIDNDAGGTIPEADLQTLIRLFEYENVSLNPTAGNRTFSFAATDADGLASTAAISTVSVSGINSRPTLTTFAGSVDTTLEDTEVEITFAEISAQGNENDPDGTVTAFVVKSVPSGSLKIGATAETAIAYSAAFNNVIDATNNAYWTPALNSNGETKAFTVVARDNVGTESIGNIAVPVDVTPVNDEPTISAIADQTQNEDTATGTLSFTISDVETAASSLVVTATSSNQTLVPDGNITLGGSGSSRTINVLPGTNQNGGPATITVSVSDGDATTQTTFDVTMTAVNDAPVASISFLGYGVDEDDSLRLINGVSISDVDAGSNNVSASLSVDHGDLILSTTTGLTFTAGANSTSTFTVEGTITEINDAFATLGYRPDSNFNGSDTLTLFVDDLGNSGGGSQTSSDTASITVTAVNDAPTLDLDDNDSSGATGNDFAVTFTERDGPVNLVDTDAVLADVDNSTLASITVSLTNRLDSPVREFLAADASGTPLSANWDSGTSRLTISGPGTIAEYLAVLKRVTYDNTANNPDATSRTITFVTNDGTDDSLVATTTLSFTAVNDPPEFTSNGGGESAAVEVAENSTAVTTLTSSDVDGGTPLYSISGGTDSTRFSLDANSGVLTFVSASDFESSTDSDGDNVYEVTVEVSDQNGGVDSQDISVTVTDVDEFDVSVISDSNNDADTVDENSSNGTSVGIQASATDDDGTNNSITYSLDDDSNGEFSIDPSSGQVTVASAIDREEGATRTIIVRATSDDGSFTSSDFVIAINDLNDNAPVIDSGQSFNVSEFADDGDNVGTATAADADSVGFIQNWTIVSGNDDGVFEIDSVTGELRIADNSLLNFETAEAYLLGVGTEDGTNVSETQTVTINVDDQNDAPVLDVNAGISVVEGGSVVISSTELSVSDEDETPDQIRFSVVDAPTAGRLELTDDPGVSISTFTQADLDNDLVRFVHDGSEADDSFTFSVSDGSDGTIGTTLFSITNFRVNDAPVNSVPVSQTANEDASLTFSSANGNAISVSDVDLDGGMIGVRLVATNGAITLSSTSGLVFANGTGTSDTSMVFAGLIDDVNSALEGLTFDPALDYNGPASIRIVSRDMGNSGSGGEQIDDDTIDISVTAVNDNPAAVGDEYSTNEDSPLTVNAANGLLANDSDIDGDDLSVVAVSGTSNGTLSLNADGSFFYTPNSDFNGTDSFTYQATDGSLQSEIQTVTLTVAPINDAPVSIDDEFTVDQFGALTLEAADGVLVNDLDADADELQSVLVDSPVNGQLILNADGSLTYTPNGAFSGEDTFTYRSIDGTDDGSVAAVRIIVRQTVIASPTVVETEVEITNETDTTTDENTPTNEVESVSNDTPGVAGNEVSDSSGEPTVETEFTAPASTVPNEDANDTTSTATDTSTDDGSSADSESTPATLSVAYRVDDRGELRDRMTGRIVEDAGVVVFTSTDVGSMVYVLEQTGFWTELDSFEQDVKNSILEEGEWEELVVETTTVAGTTLTVGYIVWLLRSGSVVFGLVSSLPAWTMMDPLPVLQSGLESLGEGDDLDDDSLQDILQAHHDGMETPDESFEN